MTSLNPDWLDALAIVRREIGDIQPIFNMVEHIDWNDFHHQLVHLHWSGDKVRVNLRANMPQFAAKIERVEVMIYLAAGLAYNQGNVFETATSHPMWRSSCRRLGCHYTNTADIRERWRLLDFETPLHLLPSAPFEDRPRCTLCHSPVATGAGANVKAGTDLGGPRLATGEELIWWQALTDNQRKQRVQGPGVYIRYKDNVHEECMRFAHRVLVPARRIQQEAERVKAAGEVDK